MADKFNGKSVSLVGSGPGCLDNKRGEIDDRDIVVRVNNYKLVPGTGRRTNVHYSYYGNAIRKSADELKRDGVTLCMCKCPDAHAIESEWHRRNNKMAGVDFRWIYKARKQFWFCDTYIPAREKFLSFFALLNGHVPSTGFAALLEIASFQPREIYLTGFDFFKSGVHNVNEKWKAGNPTDPICHSPKRELEWLVHNARRRNIRFDRRLRMLTKGRL